MKILFITHYFQPEPNSVFGLPLAKKLMSDGHQVQVITGFPNYPEGRIYDSYRGKLFMREDMDGVDVIRFPLYPSHDQSSFKRILCYTSLSICMAIIAPFIVQKADVAYVLQGPATLGFPSAILKLFRGIPFVYAIQDLWPDSLLSTGMFQKGFLYRIISKWCKFVYNRASKIIVISPGMKRLLVDRGVNADKIAVIYNWADDVLANSPPTDDNLKRELSMMGKFNIVFAGNMGNAQGLESVIGAAENLEVKYPDIQFVFIGSGVDVDRLKGMVANKKLSNVTFHAPIPIEQIGSILKTADVLLVHLRKDPLFEITIPSKTQAYMSIGRPILMGVEGDAANLVKSANAGVYCKSQDPESIADTAKKMYEMPKSELDMMGQRGFQYYQEHLSFSVVADQYKDIFCSAAKKAVNKSSDLT